MEAAKIILWFVGTCISVAFIFEYIGFSGLTRMFPEGYRWWHFPVQLLTLGVFATLVLLHPFH